MARGLPARCSPAADGRLLGLHGEGVPVGGSSGDSTSPGRGILLRMERRRIFRQAPAPSRVPAPGAGIKNLRPSAP